MNLSMRYAVGEFAPKPKKGFSRTTLKRIAYRERMATRRARKQELREGFRSAVERDERRER